MTERHKCEGQLLFVWIGCQIKGPTMATMVRAACLLLLLGASASAGDLPEHLKKVAEAGERRRAVLLKLYERELATVKVDLTSMKNAKFAKSETISKNARGRNVYFFRNKEDKADRIQEQEELVAQVEATFKELKESKYIAPELDIATIKVGDIGHLQPRTTLITVVQVIDDDNVIVGAEKTLLWVKSPTMGLVDDRPATFSKPFEVKSTKRYATAGGATNTVFYLVPFVFPE